MAGGKCNEWSVTVEGDNVYLDSSDFTHDARLYVTGDFSDKDEHYQYAIKLA